MREAVAVTMRPDDLAGQVVQAVLDKVPRGRPL
jgi:hypothetical protein